MVEIAILGAGSSRRFGRQKLLEPWREQPLIAYPLNAAQEVCPGRVTLIAGKRGDDQDRVFAGLADRIVYNDRHEAGIGTSISTAVRSRHARASAIIIALGDQPLITAAHFRDLIARWNGDEGRIIATAYEGTVGPPVLFGRRYFDELEALDGDSGAKSMIVTHHDHVAEVEFPPAAFDVDTREDWNKLTAMGPTVKDE